MYNSALLYQSMTSTMEADYSLDNSVQYVRPLFQYVVLVSINFEVYPAASVTLPKYGR